MATRVVSVPWQPGGLIMLVSNPRENNTDQYFNDCAGESQIVVCRFCGSPNTVKFGFNQVNGERKQRYWCKDCNAKFTPSNQLIKPIKFNNNYQDIHYENQTRVVKICKTAKRIVYPFIDLNLHYTARYSTKVFLDLLAHTAIEHDFTENGSKTFRINRDDSPVAHTLLYHIGKFRINDVMDMFTKGSEEIFKLVKQSNVFKKRKLDIAIDYHDIPYWGDKSHPMLVRTPKEQGTTYAFRFATVAIVENGRQFTLLTLPVSPLDKNCNVVDRLIAFAKNLIPIDTVYLDRGFYSAEVINVLKKNQVKFLMVAVRNQAIKRLLRENYHRKIIDYTMGKSTTFKVVITEKNGEKHAFATNLNVGIKRRFLSLYELYGKRWNIETSYRLMDHDFKARTTSKKYVVRLFYFLYCVLLYNLWILSNIILASWMLKFIPKKPLVSTKYFGKVFVNIDPG